MTPEETAAALRAIDDAYQAFAVRFRKDIGRSMTTHEWALARLAHCDGYTEGFQAGSRLVAAGLEAVHDEAQAGEGSRP